MKFLRKQSEFFGLIRNIYVELQNISALLQKFSGDFQNFEQYAAAAKAIEHAGDTQTHQVITTLNKLFVTPFDREDIYLLVQELDDVIDLIENVFKNIFLYGIAEELPPLKKFAELISEATMELGKMLDCLEELKYSETLILIKIKIHELEDAGDAVFHEAISTLFQEETDAIQILKRKDILEALEEVMDKYQKISNIIEGILVKSN